MQLIDLTALGFSFLANMINLKDLDNPLSLFFWSVQMSSQSKPSMALHFHNLPTIYKKKLMMNRHMEIHSVSD